MSRVKVNFDLWTPIGRALMRAHLDVIEAYEGGADASRLRVVSLDQGDAPRPLASVEIEDAARRAAPTGIDGWSIAHQAPAEAAEPPKQPSAQQEAAGRAAPAASHPFDQSEPGIFQGSDPAELGSRPPTSAVEAAVDQGAASDISRREQPAGEEAEALPPAEEPRPAGDDYNEDLERLPGADPVEPEPAAPIDYLDVASEGDGDPLDPERPWTDALRLQVWRMREADGMRPTDIASALNLRVQRVHSFFSNVKFGSVKLPAETGGASTALAPVSSAGALATVRRPPAQDPQMVEGWRQQREQREREKRVTRSIYPETATGA